MVKSIFTFGQRGGFYFECPSEWQFASLPSGFQALHDQKEIAAVYCACLGADDSYVVSYKGKDGMQHLASNGIPPQLRSWLYEKNNNNGTAVRDFENLYITLGPYNESWFATDGSSYRWMNLPAQLDAALESRLKKDGGWTVAPRLVALGVGGDFIMVTAAGGGAWQLGNYKWLDSLIGQMKEEGIEFENIETISLNAYRLQNAVFQATNGTTYWSAMQPAADSAATSIELASQKDAQRLSELEEAQQALQEQRLMYQMRNMRRLQNAQNIASIVGTLAGLTLGGPSTFNTGGFGGSSGFGFDSSSFWDPLQDAASMPIQ